MDRIAAMQKLASLAAQCPVVQPVADAESLPIHIEHYGDEGPRILVVHGGVQGAMGGGPKTFGRQAALAESGYRIEIVDRPGFGRSPSRGVDDMDASAVWIADALGDGAHLMGHSWGGAAVLMAAARRPEAVHSLILVEAALQTLAITDSEVQADPTAMDRIFAMVNVWMKAETPRDYALNALESVGRSTGEMGAGAAEFDDETLLKWGCSALQMKMSSPPALRQAAETVAQAGIPVLVISGRWSDPIQAVGDVAARATKGTHVRMDAPNHYPQFENPAEFNRIVDSFIRSHAART